MRFRPTLAFAVALALAGCAPGLEAPPGIEPPRRDPAAVDIVGSSLLVRVKSGPLGEVPSFVDLWIEHAGLEAEDPRIFHAFTGDGGGMTLFCRLGGGPQPERLRQGLASLPSGDPARASVEYALAHPDYLTDATFALLTRRVTREEAGFCRIAGIEFREFVVGELACPGGTCPVVLVLKPERLGESPLARQMVQVLADDPGLLGDTVGLALAGVGPLSPLALDRTRVALQELQRLSARPAS